MALYKYIGYYSPDAAACGGFAAEGTAGRRYRSIAARPSPQAQQRVAAVWRATVNVGSAMFTADVGSGTLTLVG